MPDHEEKYAKQIAEKYKGCSNEWLRSNINQINKEMIGLKVAKNHLESLISENNIELNDLLFELLRRAKTADEEVNK